MTTRVRPCGIVVLWLMALMTESINAQGAHPVSAAVLNEILAEPLLTPATGSIHGDVTIVEYFDYDCPVCRRIEPELLKLVAGDPKLRLVRKDWPVFGEASVYAAYCAFAAAREGKYASAHEALIGSRKDLDSKEDVQQVLRDAGFDLSRIEADIALHTDDYKAALARNRREADELGLRGTPGLIVGDQLVPGGLDYAQLERLIAQARRAAKR
jgi:protein-disulfide isomerase